MVEVLGDIALVAILIGFPIMIVLMVVLLGIVVYRSIVNKETP